MEKIYLSNADLKRIEMDAEKASGKKFEIESAKKSVEISKLELNILEKDVLLKRIEIESKIEAVRIKKGAMKAHRESLLGFIKTLEKKYKIKKFIGYNPDSGEIAEE